LHTAFYREKQVQGWSRNKKEALKHFLVKMMRKTIRKTIFTITNYRFTINISYLCEIKLKL